ncbi:MAG: SDR family NAD(P)-dependent oxidoreductase [Burkholderiales bacterium]
MPNIAVIGASGAIGSAFVHQLALQQDVEHIFAFSRSEATFALPKVTSGFIDVTDENSIILASQTITEYSLCDLIIIATGILHQDLIMPEKSLRDLTRSKFEQVFAVNTIGPALVMKHFFPKLKKDTRAVFAALSARVGSISDNQLGGWYSYRASKAALNMLIKNASIEMKRRYKQVIIVGLHPGTVESELSKPFQANIKPEHLFSPEQSAALMLEVLDRLTIEDSGKCFAYNGTEVLA